MALLEAEATEFSPYTHLATRQALFLRKAGLSQLIDCEDVKSAQQMLATSPTDYWQTHYAFGCESARSEKRLSAASVNLLLINTVVPMLFAYGRHKRDERLCDRAFAFLDQLRAEDNHIVRMWKACGLPVETLATRRRSYSSRTSIATGAIVCAAASATSFSRDEALRRAPCLSVGAS